MTNRAQITQQAACDGVPATTVERDYALAHIVAAVGALAAGHGLVFKGGTALRLCYFEDYRYSADLDFSVVDGDRDGAYASIDAALAAVSGAIDALSLTEDEPRRIEYQGPLGRLRSLKLDLADDELVLDVATVGVLRRWPDLPETGSIRVYSLEEIASEKLRCVMQRMQCRDLLDLWRLFEDAGVDPRDAAEMFRCKAKHRGLKPQRFEASYLTRLAQYRRRWTTELEVHVPGDMPHFGEVERAVSRRLRATQLL